MRGRDSRVRAAQRWIALAAALAAGCGGAGDEPNATGGAEAPETADEAAPSDDPVTLDPSSACGRARTCCEAFATAVPNVVAEVACAGPAEAAGAPDADARCRGMTEGWREALRLLPDVDPPPACSP